MATEHIVGYTHASTSHGLSCGERFDKLENACEKFESWFIHTGNTKYRSFNSTYGDERDGINLVQRGGISLILRLANKQRINEDHIKFCLFCGAEIKLMCTKKVELKERKKEVSNGYEEIVTWEKPKTEKR